MPQVDLNDIILNMKSVNVLDDILDDGLWVGPGRAEDDCKPNPPSDHVLE